MTEGEEVMGGGSKPQYYPFPGVQRHLPIQPNLSRAVPQPGTQTQFQWGSPLPCVGLRCSYLNLHLKVHALHLGLRPKPNNNAKL